MLILQYNQIHTVCPNDNAYLLYRSVMTCSSENSTVTETTANGMETHDTIVTAGTDGNNTNVDDRDRKKQNSTTESSCEPANRNFSASPVCSVALATEMCLTSYQNDTLVSR